MSKLVVSVLLTLLSMTQAYAIGECRVSLKDDVIIDSKTVVLVGENGRLAITPQGQVSRDNKLLTVSAATRQNAITYQAALRRDLPFFHQGINLRLNNAYASLKSIVSQQLGEDSQTLVELSKLHTSLSGQLNRVLEPTHDGIIFNNKQVPVVSGELKTLLQNGFGKMLQNSFNELSLKQANQGLTGGIQSVFNSLGVLQQSMRTEWDKQGQQLRDFASESCQRVQNLKQQHTTLLAQLPH